MKNVKFVKPFSFDSVKSTQLKELQNKKGYDQIKIKRALDLIRLGKEGEQNLCYYIERSYIEGIGIHDVTLYHNKYTSQFDVILITKRGILILESKNLSGELSVYEDGTIAQYNKHNGDKYLQNPKTQVNVQRDTLRATLIEHNLIDKHVPVIGKGVITSECPLITYKSEKAKTHYFIAGDFSDFYSEFETQHPELLNEEQINLIVQCICNLNMGENPYKLHELDSFKSIKNNEDKSQSIHSPSYPATTPPYNERSSNFVKPLNLNKSQPIRSTSLKPTPRNLSPSYLESKSRPKPIYTKADKRIIDEVNEINQLKLKKQKLIEGIGSVAIITFFFVFFRIFSCIYF